MDQLARHSAHLVDVCSLYSVVENERQRGRPLTRRAHEILSICKFALCIENQTKNRYLIGFQVPGIPDETIQLERVFDKQFGELDNSDFLLVDAPKGDEQQLLHHRTQLVSYVNQPMMSESNLVEFLERKKMHVPRDNDLRLVIHIEQEGPFNYSFLSAYLQHRQPACPYSQVFAFGQHRANPAAWFCVQVYPELAVLPELDEATANELLRDRRRYTQKDPPEKLIIWATKE